MVCTTCMCVLIQWSGNDKRILHGEGDRGHRREWDVKLYNRVSFVLCFYSTVGNMHLNWLTYDIN